MDQGSSGRSETSELICPVNVILEGDVRKVIASIPDDVIQTIVTSPPYWNLRDYQVEGQIGLEATPTAYVDVMVQAAREWRRILRPDGTLFLNVGDTWFNFRPEDFDDNRSHAFGGERVVDRGLPAAPAKRKKRIEGLKDKDLVGIPWMLAFALRADGWYLRSEIIWHKPNPMPGSVEDRPIYSHEQIFLLSKRHRYYWNPNAIREKQNEFIRRQDGPQVNIMGETSLIASAAHKRGGFNDYRSRNGIAYNPLGRNSRSVWTFPTERGFGGEHTATFPKHLVRRCVLASTPDRSCGICGKPWKTVVEKKGGTIGQSWNDHSQDVVKGHRIDIKGKPKRIVDAPGYEVRVLGEEPGCKHDDGSGRSIVFDPFMGTGTVARVAKDLNRYYLGIEINPSDIAIANERLRQEALSLVGEDQTDEQE